MTVWLPVLVAVGLAVPVLVPPPSNASVLKSPEEALEDSVWALQERFDAINETLNLFSLENSERARVRMDSVDAELLENRREAWKGQRDLYVEMEDFESRRQEAENELWVEMEDLEKKTEEADNELWKGQRDIFVEIDGLDIVLYELRKGHDEFDETLSQFREWLMFLEKKYDDKSSELRGWVEFLETRVQYNEKELDLYENTLPADELEKRVDDLEMLQIKLQIQFDEHAVVTHQDVVTLDEQADAFLAAVDLESRIEAFEERLVVLDQRFGDFLIMYRTDARKKDYEAYVEDEKRSKAGIKHRDDVVTNGRLQEIEADVAHAGHCLMEHGSRIGLLERELLAQQIGKDLKTKEQQDADDIYDYLDNKIREAVHTIQREAEEKLEMRFAQVNALVDTLNHAIRRINKIEDTTNGLFRGPEWD